NPMNHKPGIPLEWISYHFYAVPSPDETPDNQEHTFFAQAEGFLSVVRYIESIRQRLSPSTKTTIDEIGAISAEDLTQGEPGYVFKPIPAWLHKTEKPVEYPADPDQVTWNYTQRTEPRDPSFKEIADYYARLLAWYTQGGFTDELGKRHESGHR
ncbi:MAG: hypothetical protein DMF79_12300, partial [Acidobacteria bacterium]